MERSGTAGTENMAFCETSRTSRGTQQQTRDLQNSRDLLKEMIKVKTETLKAKQVSADETPHDKYLNYFITAIIILNVASIGICSDLVGTIGLSGLCKSGLGSDAVASQECNNGCDALDYVFLVVFTIELIYKWKDIKENWKDFYNLVDIAVVATGVLDGILTPLMRYKGVRAAWVTETLKLFRLLRILRVVKLLRKFRKLTVILEGLLLAIKSMMWIGLLLAVLIYCAAIIGLMYFKNDNIDFGPAPGLTFNTLPMACFTMFSVSIAADWTPIVMPIVDYYWWGGVFWGAFSFVTSLGMLNLIIGMITENAAAVQRDYDKRDNEAQQTSKLQSLKVISDKFFPELDVPLTHHEFNTKVDEANEEMAALFGEIPLPVGWSIKDCFPLLDHDHDGHIGKFEFEGGMCQMIVNTEEQSSVCLQAAVAGVARTLQKMEKRLDQEKESDSQPGFVRRLSEIEKKVASGDHIGECLKRELSNSEGPVLPQILNNQEKNTLIFGKAVEKLALRLHGLERKLQDELGEHLTHRIEECLGRSHASGVQSPRSPGGSTAALSAATAAAGPYLSSVSPSPRSLGPPTGPARSKERPSEGRFRGYDWRNHHEALFANLAAATRAAESVRRELGANDIAAATRAVDSVRRELDAAESVASEGAVESRRLVHDAHISELAHPAARRPQQSVASEAAAESMAHLGQDAHISELSHSAASRNRSPGAVFDAAEAPGDDLLALREESTEGIVDKVNRLWSAGTGGRARK